MRDAVMREMRMRNHDLFDTYLTYVVSRGSESIDFVDALQILESIQKYTVSHRIELFSNEHHLPNSSYVLILELGKCLNQVQRTDVVFLSTPDQGIMASLSHCGRITADIVHIVNETDIFMLESEWSERVDRNAPTESAPRDETQSNDAGVPPVDALHA